VRLRCLGVRCRGALEGHASGGPTSIVFQELGVAATELEEGKHRGPQQQNDLSHDDGVICKLLGCDHKHLHMCSGAVIPRPQESTSKGYHVPRVGRPTAVLPCSRFGPCNGPCELGMKGAATHMCSCFDSALSLSGNRVSPKQSVQSRRTSVQCTLRTCGDANAMCPADTYVRRVSPFRRHPIWLHKQ
jgi:hypothetical protein